MRPLPETAFGDDDGSADAQVTAALRTFVADGRRLPVLAVLQHARVLVPVVAVLGDQEETPEGLRRDKSSEMATVLLTGRTGRQALLAFTSTDALRDWDPRARPVAVTLRQAAASARQEGADALLLDVAGPVRFAVEGGDLAAMADGLELAELPEGYAWVRRI